MIVCVVILLFHFYLFLIRSAAMFIVNSIKYILGLIICAIVLYFGLVWISSGFNYTAALFGIKKLFC